MTLLIAADGSVHCLYAETIDLGAFGPQQIRRASHVEPESNGCWRADLSPVGGPQLGPFGTRSQALAAEASWLEQHWLIARG
jgi:hypothetical protein